MLHVYANLFLLEGLAALPLHSLRNHFLETVVLGDEFVEPEIRTYFLQALHLKDRVEIEKGLNVMVKGGSHQAQFLGHWCRDLIQNEKHNI